MEKVYYDGITEKELLHMWEWCGQEFFDNFEDFKKDYIQSRKNEHQKRRDNIERHNWLYSLD